MNTNRSESNHPRKSTQPVFSYIGACLLIGMFLFGATSVNAAEEHEKSEKEHSQTHSEKEGSHYVPSSEFIGSEVQDDQKNHIGEVYDLVVNLEKEQSPLIVVSFNDFLGYGGDLFALPWQGVTHIHKDGACVLGIQKESEVPSQKDQDWIGLESEREGESKTVSEFGMTPYWVKKDETKAVQEKTQQTQSRLISANDIVGSEVKGENGEEFGTISDLVVHSDDGAIACSILSMGDYVGIGGTQYPVPVSLLKKAEDEGYTLKADKETILKAPVYDSEATIKKMDRSWVENLHQHYGVKMITPESHQYQAPQTSESPDEAAKSREIAARETNEKKEQ